MATEAAESAASSSTTLWAQASKEWVIPAKPKPGRKPKKDSPPSNETKETDSKGRRVQNRAAQRAFRERKQSQLAELQARVQSYEQGEIERNVALQQISKRLKEENEQLKAENDSLKEEIARLKERVASTSASSPALSSHHDGVDKGKSQKRWREDTIGSVSGNDTSIILEPAARKRFRHGTESPPSTSVTSQYGQLGSYLPSSPSVASSPDSNGVSRSPFSPLPFAPLPHASGSGHASTSYSTSAVFSASPGDSLKAFDSLSSAPPFDAFDCGLCNENTPCVCRELAMQTTGNSPEMSGSLTFGNDYSISQDKSSSTLKVEDTESRMSAISNVIEIPPAVDGPETSVRPGKSTSPEIAVSYQYSTLVRQNALSEQHNNKGPYQIRLPSPEPTPTTAPSSRSVPLSLKKKRRSVSGKVWQLESPSPTCSGDPSNCPACKDDDFGKAFCRALGDSASTVEPACASCPNPEACGKMSRSAVTPESSSSSVPSSSLATNGSVLEVASPDPKRVTHSSQETTSRDSRTSGSSSSLATPAASVSVMPEGKSPKLSETIPANEAWARLKSHPNIAFADLSMLADVVARRTKCSGPVAVINPAPGSITPERDVARSPVASKPQEIIDGGEPERKDKPVLLTDPHAHFRAQEQQRAQVLPVLPPSGQSHNPAVPDSRIATSSALSLGPGAIGRPALVPQEELRECGRRRIREVDAAGVREALRILDAQFGKHT